MTPLYPCSPFSQNVSRDSYVCPSLHSLFRVAMHYSSSASSFSVFTIFQYAFLALIAYVLAGAPLQEILFGRDGSGSSYSYHRDASVSSMSPQKLESLVIPDANLTCDEHAFKSVHVLSREPLVVYIEGFLGEKEANEVVELR